MTRNRFLVAVSALSFTALSAFAAYEDVTLERYPDADVVMLDGLSDVVYNPDGTYSGDYTQSVKILTEKGRRDESQLSISYNKRYGKAEIVSVSVESPDGSRRDIDIAATTKESTDNSSASENIYDPLARKIVCSIPGLKVGDILHSRTKRTVLNSRIEKQWADIEVLEWECPILRQTMRVTCPKELPLKRIAVRNPLGNVQESESTLDDGRVVRTWVATNSPQAFPEPDMPPLYTQIQALRTSTASDWREISRWYWNLCVPHLDKVNDVIKAKVAELGNGIPEIYKWVAQEIRYMGLTMEDTSPGYSPHDVDITFGNRYGVCRDKAALLAAMLRVAGHNAYPVLIHVGAKMDQEVPMPYFNHAIVAVHAPGDPCANADGYILMDPTDESSRDLLPAYLGDRSYLVARPEGETLLTSPVQPPEANAVRVDTKATVSRDGSMMLESRIDFTGVNDNIYRSALLRRKPEERRKVFENAVRNVMPGAELASCKIEPADLQDTAAPLAVFLSARIPEAVIRGKNRSELALPLLSRSLGSANWVLSGKTSLEKRRFPLVVDSTAMVDEKLEIDIGDMAFKPHFLPSDEKIDGSYSYLRKCEVKDGVLSVRRTLSLGAVEFSPDEYLELREKIKSVEKADRERPVFETERFADANVHYFTRRDIVNLTSARDWTTTNEVSMQILTYDGKKKHSELKQSFNPVWQTVDVIDVVVSNANGKVSRLDEREKNVFDCSWAPTAPRYPASKQLVVNLPGVEVGSFVNYKIVKTARNAPAEFYGSWYLDVVEPTDEIALIVNDWGRKAVEPSVIPPETLTASGELWRDMVIVSSNDFSVAAQRLRTAADVDPVDPVEATGMTGTIDIKRVRDWMSLNIRVDGPSLYDLPLEMQTTDPATVIAERYGTRLDYVRAMTALLKGAGYDADIVFAAADADKPESLRRRDMFEKPCVRAFRFALCRVVETRGGFLGIGGEKTVTYLGVENEYSPLGATSFQGCSYFDPESGKFGVVEPTNPVFESKTGESMRIAVRANGAADIDYESLTYGAGVGEFRKRYAEMLPEDRSRHYQELLGDIALAASATGELVTDIESYPAKLSFSAYVPGYAVVAGDSITLSVPGFYMPPFPLNGSVRRNPIGVPAAESSVERFEVTFPEGYTVAESLPSAYAETDPLTGAKWIVNTVDSFVRDGRLVVVLKRTVAKRSISMLPKEYFQFMREYSRVASSRANRTIIVRRP